MNRSLVRLGLAAAALVVGAVLGSLEGRPSSVPNASIPTSVAVGIEVHVAGWVISPGVVTLGEGAIVADAIAAAGGLRLGARSDLINLAASVGSGEQIVVPGPEEVGAVAAGDGLISLNRATASDLEALPGVGPVLAERIAAFRDTNGPFGQVEDLLQVPGIGEAKLASIRDLIRVP